jgi:simple sugar transport system permease protein
MASLAVRWSHLRYRLAVFPELVALISFLVVFLFFAAFAPNFLSPVSVSNMLTFGSNMGIIVIGVAILMIAGEFDLSVGSNFAVASYVFALSMNEPWGMAPLLAMLLALSVSTTLGLLNGVIVIWGRIPSFIATLGTMLAYRGIARALGHSDFAKYTGEPPALFSILNGPLTRLNELSHPAGNFRLSIIWFIVLAVLMVLVMNRSRWGNWIYAVGGNEGAALAQGVPVRRVKLSAFALTGLLVGLAGVMQFAMRTSIDPIRGEGWELLAVAGSVIGGVALTGGVGTLFGACLGILLLQMLDQGLLLMGLSVDVFRGVAGFILMLSVVINQYLGRFE